MEAYEFIEGHKEVVAHFGQWPSFHDAEVHCLTLHRPAKTTTGTAIPTLELHLRGWILKQEVSDTGFYKLHGDAVVHFQFEGIFDLQIEGFNNQNVLSSMGLEVIDDQCEKGSSALKVELEHCYEFEASFKTHAARIISITPYA